jgi:hypothetical protein
MDVNGRLDSPFCELRPGIEWSSWGVGYYWGILGECGLAFPLVNAGDWYTLKFVATPSVGMMAFNTYDDSVDDFDMSDVWHRFPVLDAEIGLENRFPLGDHWGLLLAVGIEAEILFSSPSMEDFFESWFNHIGLFIPVSIGFEFADRTK